ncbi:MAG TPA: glycosyltransferase family 2 protein [Cyanobacteria bacterium UBA8803]|nr:glycosyltransferase family 2 protein [Cyanobacteria bacterium UBA9273]HBL58662.1 glycosyltransferase family 2 protein [Cyanobacteria bacterium UBA8803]
MSNINLVSVIIPVYNCDRYLAEAIESVLNQTYQPLEVIVIDDGSTDGSAEVAKSFHPSVRYYYQPQSGAGAARNYGIDLAQGSFLAFLDADDIWVPDKLTQQMEVLENEPQVDMVFGHIQQFHSPELAETVKNKIHCPPNLMAGYHPGTMVIKREAFLRVGKFDTNLQMGEFINWYSLATDLGLQPKILPGLLMRRRLHGNNLGLRQRQSRTDYVRLIKASLDRRRTANKEERQ